MILCGERQGRRKDKDKAIVARYIPPYNSSKQSKPIGSSRFARLIFLSVKIEKGHVLPTNMMYMHAREKIEIALLIEA